QSEGQAKQDGGQDQGLSLTPGFAAPERYSGSPPTTLGDVYSLGRLLEELTRDCRTDEDINAIASRATAAEPERRYPSADAMADDITRYLDGRPVEAREGGSAYALRKFVARNRGP